MLVGAKDQREMCAFQQHALILVHILRLDVFFADAKKLERHHHDVRVVQEAFFHPPPPLLVFLFVAQDSRKCERNRENRDKITSVSKCRKSFTKGAHGEEEEDGDDAAEADTGAT